MTLKQSQKKEKGITITPRMDEGDVGTSSATRKAAVGTATTVILRLLSFAGTQWCYRRLDPATLGRANVRLELILTSILFMSREGFRLALTRDTTTNGVDNQGTAWLTVPVTTIISVSALLWHLHATKSDSPTQEDVDYQLAGVLYCVAAAIEGWAEPAVLQFLRSLSISEKATAEGIAVLAKTATTVLALQYLQDKWPVTSFGVAQIAYAVVYFGVLYGRLWGKHQRISWSNMFHGPTIYMTLIFTAQGVLKFALTEGDRIVMTLLAGSYDQGVYAMGSAYGGLAARLILQPAEESARLLYSRLAATANSSAKDTTSSSSKDQPAKNEKDKPKHGADPLLELSYVVLVKLVLYVGLIFSCLAVNYTQILLNLLAGRKWGDNPEAVSVLSAFCVYTAFLAWNGMTEAFVYGVASSVADVGRLGVAHTVTGLLFAVAAPIAVARAGTVGLVAANCAAMFGRAVFSVHFAARYFAAIEEKPVSFVFARLLRQMFPAQLVILSFVAAYFGTRASANRLVAKIAGENVETGSIAWLRLSMEHISVGAAFAIGILTLAYVLERDVRSNIRTLWHGKTA
jgi:oligosaccharide translocation protein RFT1